MCFGCDTTSRVNFSLPLSPRVLSVLLYFIPKPPNPSCVFGYDRCPCQVVSGSKDSSLRAWDLRTGRARLVSTQHFGGVQCLALDASADGGRGAYYSGARDATVQVFVLSMFFCYCYFFYYQCYEYVCYTYSFDSSVSIECCMQVLKIFSYQFFFGYHAFSNRCGHETANVCALCARLGAWFR